jgi:hypothetical protein
MRFGRHGEKTCQSRWSGMNAPRLVVARSWTLCATFVSAHQSLSWIGSRSALCASRVSPIVSSTAQAPDDPRQAVLTGCDSEGGKSMERAYFPPSPSANRPGSPLYVPNRQETAASLILQPTPQHSGLAKLSCARRVDHRSCRRNLGRLRAAPACASRSPCLLRSARARLSDSAARSRNPLALRMILR